MNYNSNNIPHQYRNPYWRGSYQLDGMTFKDYRKYTTSDEYTYGVFSFDSQTGILSVTI